MKIERIPSDELTLDIVPQPDAPWERIFRFAATFHMDTREAGDVANLVADEYRLNDGKYPKDLDILRTCLFFEWRRTHHIGDAPSGEGEIYVRGLVREIRSLLE